LTSGQLTPFEPMVYTSPMATHENVFEHAFQAEQERIRAQGEGAVVYNTWRSEELTGVPISNEYGRAKVELEKVDAEEAPRWERILREKFPERLAEIYQRKEDKSHFLKGMFAHKLMREQASENPGETTMGGLRDDRSSLPIALTKEEPVRGQKLSAKAHKRLDALRSAVATLKAGSTTQHGSANSNESGDV